jgi:thermitase
MGIHGGIVKSLIKASVLTLITGAFAQAKKIESVPGEFIVKLKKEHKVETMNPQFVASSLGAYVQSAIPEGNLLVVRRAAFETQSSAIQQLANNEMVEYVEPNFIYSINKTPNDPLLGNLWGIKNIGQKDSANNVGTPGVDVGAEAAWDIQTGSQDLVVAVIDTGVDFNHPDLKENSWTNQAELSGKPGVDDDNNGVVDDIYGANFVSTNPTGASQDDHGHGSHCAGTIGAKGDDGKGIVGVAWNVRLMGVKFLSAQGYGSLEGAIKSIDYARKMGAKIMSNSWGGGGFSKALEESIQRAHDAGILFIAAAGNDSSDNDTNPQYPANYNVPNVISVAAIDNQGRIARFSNYGRRTVHVGAPGVNVFSSVTGNGYDSWSGTSMATPHVTGVAALLASNQPELTHVQLKERIIKTSRAVPGLKNRTVAGLANAYYALVNESAPPDMNDPANWQFKPLAISTQHPYKSKTRENYEVDMSQTNNTIEVFVANARQIAIHFSKFETERNYDKVEFFDKSNAKVGEMSGVNDDSFSPVINGDYVKMVFSSDDSVEKYGFDTSKVAYR